MTIAALLGITRPVNGNYFGIVQWAIAGISAQGENFAFPDDGEWPCGRTVGKDDDGAERFRFVALKAKTAYPSDYDAG